MTLLPKVKLKAAVNFPATVRDGTGIDVTKSNGTYRFDLDFGDFAPPVTSLPDATHQNALVWNSLTGAYLLAPVSVFSGAVTEAPLDGQVYGRLNGTWTNAWASPTLTGNPIAPTPSPGDNDTSIATTAFVTAAISAIGAGAVPATAVPIVESGVGAVGSSIKYAREDHIHPRDLTSDPFIQAGTGAVNRTMQDKARERVSTPDFSTATQAASAITTATGGGTVSVPNGVAATLPASYPNINFEYFGPAIPNNQYTATGPAEATATRLIRGQLPKSTTGTAQGVLAIEARPVGADVNGPAQGSYALNISSIKQGWDTTTQPGEVGGISVVTRNGGTSGGVYSDVSGMLLNVQNIGNTGFAVGIEGRTTNIQTGTGTLLMDMDYEIGTIDTITGTSYGLALLPSKGNFSSGIFLQPSATGSFQNAIQYASAVGATIFLVDGSGNIQGTEITLVGTAWTSYTPTVVFSSGAGTTSGRYKKIGKTIHISLQAVCTTAGNISTISLPVALHANFTGVLAGREINRTGIMWGATMSGTGPGVANIFNYANSAAMIINDTLIFSGSYECA